MMNCNWIVTLAITNQKALIAYGYTDTIVYRMSAQEVTAELKELGHNFKKNSPFKNR